MGLGAVLATPQTSVAETIEWRVQSLFPAGTSDYGVFRDYFVPLVEKMSAGRLIIKPFAGDAIIKNKEALDAVASGTFEAAQESPAYWTGKDPAFVFVRNASAGFEEAWQYHAWLYQGGGIELARELYATQGVHLVGLTLRPGESLHFKGVVKSLQEFRDMAPKVRTIPGIPTDLFSAMGGSPLYMSGSEVYSAMDKGVIDVGEWTGLAANYGIGMHLRQSGVLGRPARRPQGDCRGRRARLVQRAVGDHVPGGRRGAEEVCGGRRRACGLVGRGHVAGPRDGAGSLGSVAGRMYESQVSFMKQIGLLE
jgi:TRAP-type mannitol/chloroaromatic compound transport system substrate-binding protein